MGSPNMRSERARRVLARNLRHFLAMTEMSENALAQRCKISQKQVNNITNARTGCGIDALAEMANVLNIEPWMLIHEDGAKIRRPSRMSRVVTTYLEATEEDRDLIDQLIQKSFHHRATKNDKKLMSE